MPDPIDATRKDLSGVKVAILGGGISGTSLALLAARLGAEAFLSDASEIAEGSAKKLRDAGISYEEHGHTVRLLDADLVVASSGFPPSAAILKKIGEKGIPMIGELDFALPYVNAKVIGITGSNGKTTTTSLAGFLFSKVGRKAAVAGNIGSPIADFAATGETYDYIVTELSSFQLHWARKINLEGAVVTNLAPDHIDWHGSFENYAAAKAKILSFVKPDGFCIVQERDMPGLNHTNEHTYRLSWGSDQSDRDTRKILLDADRKAAFIEKNILFAFGETSLLGSHNMENVAMAMASLYLSGEGEKGVSGARQHLAGYVPPPHRCALVLEKHGVRYVNDSKGTNIAATVTALSSIEGKKVIILGGKGKGEDYRALAEPLRAFARCAILIGEEAHAIAKALDAEGYTSHFLASGMEEAVRMAASKADDGDVVLLSPACTSWDMYTGYPERGKHFASLVKSIVGGGA